MKSQGSPTESNEISSTEITTDFLLKHPWYIWKEKEKCDLYLRTHLHKALISAIRLKLFRTYIQTEVNKKISRKGAAIRRAYNASKQEANKLFSSLPKLNLEQLWKIIEVENSHDDINKRLDKVLSNGMFHLLKNVSDEEQAGSEQRITSDEEEGEDVEVDDRSEEAEELVSGEGGESKETKVKSDQFFSMEEMEMFANEDYDFGEDDIDYFDSLDEESDGSVPAAEMKYDDFFKKPDELEEDEEMLERDSNLKDLDEDERKMELLLQKLEGEAEEEEEEDNYRDDGDEDFFLSASGLEANTVKAQTSTKEVQSSPMNDEISKIENEIIAPRHWSLMGESIGTKRTRNSLLDIDIELPHTSATLYDKEREELGEDEGGDEVLPLELIIAQRIKAGVFDNVERKIPLEDQLEAIERLKKDRKSDVIELDFNKSNVGLGDIYAQRYKEQFTAIDKLDGHKQELTELFAKLMYKLDCLSNANFVPKRLTEAEKANNVPMISIHEPINIIPAVRTAHKETEVLKVTRSAKKRKFENKLKGLIKSGKITAEQANRIKENAIKRNKEKIMRMKNKKRTGLEGDVKSNRRVSINELMKNIN